MALISGEGDQEEEEDWEEEEDEWEEEGVKEGEAKGGEPGEFHCAVSMAVIAPGLVQVFQHVYRDVVLLRPQIPPSLVAPTLQVDYRPIPRTLSCHGWLCPSLKKRWQISVHFLLLHKKNTHTHTKTQWGLELVVV